MDDRIRPTPDQLLELSKEVAEIVDLVLRIVAALTLLRKELSTRRDGTHG